MRCISRGAIGVIAIATAACTSAGDQDRSDPNDRDGGRTLLAAAGLLADASVVDSGADASKPPAVIDASASVDAVVTSSALDAIQEAGEETMIALDAGSAVDASSDVAVAQGPGVPAAGDVVVDPATRYQTMAGFGASDVFLPALTPAQAQLFFDPRNGIGLSLLRVGISSSGGTIGSGLLADVEAAASYGAAVWAAPWSPPAGDKTNNSEINGGYLCAAAAPDAGSCVAPDYESWANVLANFPAWLKAASGVSLTAISAQNEPDFSASYSSCLYTAQQMVDFVKVLGPKLAALSPPVQLVAPEPANWSHLWSGDPSCASINDYGPCIHADPTAEAAVSIFATHDYGFAPVAAPAWVAKPIWETEVSGVHGSAQVGPSVDIVNGLAVAQWIYSAIVTGGASAWHYWWLVSQASNNDNEGLLFPTGQGPNGVGDINAPPKRLYAVGNFSKFVRPGFRRIDVSGAVPAGVQIVAFQDPASAGVVIVATNLTSSAVPVSLFVSGSAWPTQLVPWVTSASANLTVRAPLSAVAARVTTTLDPQSVTTFVGAPDAANDD
jgi:glucuronoarabinoxylan endo-1,4-beta-xylanase